MTDQSPSSKHPGQMQVAWEGNTLVATLDGIRVEVAKLDPANGLSIRWLLPLPAGTSKPPTPKSPSPRERAAEWERNHGTEMLPDGLIGACEDAREIIRAMVADGILASTGHWNIAISLAERLGIPQCDGELIVMTEIRSALEYASLEGALAIGFKGKRWLTSNAPGVCPTCEANKAQGLIPIEHPFASGHQGAPAHPGCRCCTVHKAQAT